MSLLDAVIAAGPLPPDSVMQAQKKRYSEILSGHLAVEVAEGLRAVGFHNIKPTREGPGERAFQGGLGPKKIDVSYSDEQHGLILAVSIKLDFLTLPESRLNYMHPHIDAITEFHRKSSAFAAVPDNINCI